MLPTTKHDHFNNHLDHQHHAVNTFGHLINHLTTDKDARKLTILLVINLICAVLEVIYGLISNSIGLLSDSAHMLFDSTALAVGIYASYKATLPPNSKFSYGFDRFQTLSGLINGIFLIFIGFYIFIESLERMYNPPEIHSKKMIVVAVIGLIVNIVGVTFFHEHAHGHGDDHSSCSHDHSHQEKAKPDQHHHHHEHSDHESSVSHDDEHDTLNSINSCENSVKGDENCNKGCDHAHAHQPNNGGSSPSSPSSVVHKHDHSNSHSHDHHDHKHSHSHEHKHSSACSHDHSHDNKSSHNHDHKESHSHDHKHDHSHDHEHDHHHNENLYGVFLHILADLLGSVGVITSSILIMLFEWHVADAICSAITSLLILASVVPLIKSSMMVFLQTSPAKYNKAFNKAITEISHHKDIVECRDPHLWMYTQSKLVCSVILVVKQNTNETSKIVEFARKKLKTIKALEYITIDCRQEGQV